MNAVDNQIASWKASRRLDERIAGALAEWARGKETGTIVPDYAEVERLLGFEASASTYRRAKRLLRDEGVLSNAGGPFCVG